MAEGDETKVSKYSSGVNIIIRLDLLWKSTHYDARAGKYKLWNSDLDRIWLELARDIDEEDFPKREKQFDNFDKELMELGEFTDYQKEGFAKATPEEIKKRDRQYKILMKKQLFLARLENEFGKGTTFDEQDGDYD